MLELLTKLEVGLLGDSDVDKIYLVTPLLLRYLYSNGNLLIQNVQASGRYTSQRLFYAIAVLIDMFFGILGLGVFFNHQCDLTKRQLCSALVTWMRAAIM